MLSLTLTLTLALPAQAIVTPRTRVGNPVSAPRFLGPPVHRPPYHLPPNGNPGPIPPWYHHHYPHHPSYPWWQRPFSYQLPGVYLPLTLALPAPVEFVQAGTAIVSYEQREPVATLLAQQGLSVVGENPTAGYFVVSWSPASSGWYSGLRFIAHSPYVRYVEPAGVRGGNGSPLRPLPGHLAIQSVRPRR